MTKRFAIGIACFFILVTLAACKGQPTISVEQTSLDLGDVVNGEIVTKELTVENRGEGDLVIEAVTTSCGCTQATIEPETIPSGGRSTLRITLDSGAHGPEVTGQLLRQVFIASNDPRNPETSVELVVNVLPPAGQ